MPGARLECRRRGRERERLDGPAVEGDHGILQRRSNHFPQLEEAAEALWAEHGLALHTLNRFDQPPVSALRRRCRDRSVRCHARGASPLQSPQPPPRALRDAGSAEPHLSARPSIGFPGLCDPEIEAIVSAGKFLTPEADALARSAPANYFAAALLMPYRAFLAAARSTRYDINVLEHRFGVSFEQVCHRLTTLRRPGDEGVPFHLIRVDIAGNICRSVFRPPESISLGFGAACPRWNVYDAFATPGMLRVQVSKCPRARRSSAWRAPSNRRTHVAQRRLAASHRATVDRARLPHPICARARVFGRSQSRPIRRSSRRSASPAAPARAMTARTAPCPRSTSVSRSTRTGAAPRLTCARLAEASLRVPGLPPGFSSSGDVGLDRRYRSAKASSTRVKRPRPARFRGRPSPKRPIGRLPGSSSGHALVKCGARGEARGAYQRTSLLDPAGALGAGLALARLGAVSPQEAMQAGYVAALFDEYADRFDRRISRSASSTARKSCLRLARALRREGRPFRFERALDLGCGTGLMGEAIRPIAGTLAGIDLSAGMLAKARGKVSMTGSWRSSSASCGRSARRRGFVLAADVLVYVADLPPCSPRWRALSARVVFSPSRCKPATRTRRPTVSGWRGSSLRPFAKTSASGGRIAGLRGRSPGVGRDAPGRRARCRGIHGRARERARRREPETIFHVRVRRPCAWRSSRASLTRT